MTEEKQSRMHLRGFASLTPERRREIASKGGKSVPAEKRSYSKDRKLAATAGKKGGLACPSEKRPYSLDKELASRAGKIGGSAKRDPNP
jgi:general stress protein YciG